jgi:hypothetical protein
MTRFMDLDGVMKPLKSIVDRILGKDDDEEDSKKRKFATG